MKKITKICSVFAVCLLCAAMLTSCTAPNFIRSFFAGKPAENYLDASHYLDVNGYKTEISTHHSDGYTVITATKNNGFVTEAITIGYYSSEADARDSYNNFKDILENDIKSKIDELKSEIKSRESSGGSVYEINLLEESLEYYEDFVVGKSGTMVWFGTTDAIEDASEID